MSARHAVPVVAVECNITNLRKTNIDENYKTIHFLTEIIVASIKKTMGHYCKKKTTITALTSSETKCSIFV